MVGSGVAASLAVGTEEDVSKVQRLVKSIKCITCTREESVCCNEQRAFEVKDLRWYAHYNKEAIRKIAKKCPAESLNVDVCNPDFSGKFGPAFQKELQLCFLFLRLEYIKLNMGNVLHHFLWRY